LDNGQTNTPIPKADVRKLVLERRKELSAGEILDKSKRIFERLIEFMILNMQKNSGICF